MELLGFVDLVLVIVVGNGFPSQHKKKAVVAGVVVVVGFDERFGDKRGGEKQVLGVVLHEELKLEMGFGFGAGGDCIDDKIDDDEEEEDSFEDPDSEDSSDIVVVLLLPPVLAFNGAHFLLVGCCCCF